MLFWPWGSNNQIVELNMRDAHYIFLDSETGGIGLDKSLLTLYLIVTDANFNKIDDLYLYLKPPDDVYHVTGEAMEINRIDLVTHYKKAVYYKDGGTLLYNFIKRNSSTGRIKLLPVGHNMTGDIFHIHDKLMTRESWENFVSYRRLDTVVIAQYLKSCGKLPDDISGSLSSIVSYFKLPEIGNLHDAKTDTLLTMEVFKKLIYINI